MSNSFDWPTRLFCSFPNHDTTSTVVLNLHFANKNAVYVAGGNKNDGKNVHRSKL